MLHSVLDGAIGSRVVRRGMLFSHLASEGLCPQTMLGAWVVTERLASPEIFREELRERFDEQFSRIVAHPDDVSIHAYGPMRLLAKYMGV